MSKLECLFSGHLPDLDKAWETSSECPGLRFTEKTVCKRCGCSLTFCPGIIPHENGGIRNYRHWRAVERS